MNQEPLFRDVDLLITMPAVSAYQKGVSTDDLAAFLEAFSSMARSRVAGAGAQEYAQGPLQVFETKDTGDLAQDVLEELADAQNYIAMMGLRLLALLKQAEGDL